MIKQAPNELGLHPLLQKRWSARSFEQKHIPNDKLQIMFQAAAWSSSCMNEQPWRFVYGAHGSATHELIASVLMPGNALWAKEAPLLMAVFAKKQFDDGSDNMHAWHDVGAACTSLLLQGVAFGIYGHQMGGFDREKAKQVFTYADEYDIVSIIALGFLGEADALKEPFRTREVTPRTRKEPASFAFESFEEIT
ncbi:MAG: nitroreductase [Bacteroidetes bacterium]|nr:nitroreductase [bacterium]NBP63376.1 nitroreductase [Bacteroidota bacterium]